MAGTGSLTNRRKPRLRRCRRGPAGRPRGVVLLSVLLILALLSALAWQLVSQHSLMIAQVRFTFSTDQAQAYALGAESLARQVLYEDWSLGGGPGATDSLQDLWAQPVAPFDVDDTGAAGAGFLELQVRDLNRCFNLNSLAGADAARNLARLKTLLRNRGLPEGIADAWQDWVDPDQEVTGFGAEDGEYLLGDIPYRTANTPAVHVSEFRLVQGVDFREFTPEQQEVLERTLCVVPRTELRINVNTAEPEVLASLNITLNEPQMQALAESIREYQDVSAAVVEYPDLADSVDALTVSSEYFEIQVRARIDGAQVELVSLVRRDPATGELTLIYRDFGQSFRSTFLEQLNVDVEPAS